VQPDSRGGLSPLAGQRRRRADDRHAADPAPPAAPARRTRARGASCPHREPRRSGTSPAPCSPCRQGRGAASREAGGPVGLMKGRQSCPSGGRTGKALQRPDARRPEGSRRRQRARVAGAATAALGLVDRRLRLAGRAERRRAGLDGLRPCDVLPWLLRSTVLAAALAVAARGEAGGAQPEGSGGDGRGDPMTAWHALTRTRRAAGRNGSVAEVAPAGEDHRDARRRPPPRRPRRRGPTRRAG
jgi:hypothetical protein